MHGPANPFRNETLSPPLPPPPPSPPPPLLLQPPPLLLQPLPLPLLLLLAEKRVPACWWCCILVVFAVFAALLLLLLRHCCSGIAAPACRPGCVLRLVSRCCVCHQDDHDDESDYSGATDSLPRLCIEHRLYVIHQLVYIHCHAISCTCQTETEKNTLHCDTKEYR